jgi:hypothetical protein
VYTVTSTALPCATTPAFHSPCKRPRVNKWWGATDSKPTSSISPTPLVAVGSNWYTSSLILLMVMRRAIRSLVGYPRPPGSDTCNPPFRAPTLSIPTSGIQAEPQGDVLLVTTLVVAAEAVSIMILTNGAYISSYWAGRALTGRLDHPSFPLPLATPTSIRGAGRSARRPTDRSTRFRHSYSLLFG